MAFLSSLKKPPSITTNRRQVALMEVREWGLRASAVDNEWRGITWAPELGIFCAVSSTGTGDRVMTSPEGINWTSRTSATDNDWQDVTWAPEIGLFCAVSDSGTGDRVMTSPDGISWTSRTSAADITWRGIEWSPELGLFCAVGADGNAMTSSDGISWTLRSIPASNSWSSIAWSPELGLFCAVSSSGSGDRAATSPDGISWTVRASAADSGWLGIDWSPELYLFCAVASGASDQVMTSPDGINWTASQGDGAADWQSVVWAPELGLFCAVSRTGSGDLVMTSPNGKKWTARASAADNQWQSVAWSADRGTLCAVSATGTGTRVMTSLFKKATAVAAEGELSLYREATATESLEQATFTDLAWDTTVSEGSVITIQGNRTDINLGENGHYFIGFNNPGSQGTSNVIQQQHHRLNGHGSPSVNRAWIDGDQGAQEGYTAESFIIDETAAPVNRQIQFKEATGNTASLTRRANKSGAWFIKMKDTLSFLRLRHSSGFGENFDATAPYEGIDWDLQDEADAGFTHTVSSEDVTLDDAGFYLITASGSLFSTGNRTSRMFVRINGSEVDGTRVTGFSDGSGNNSGIHSLNYVGIIETTSANDVLDIALGPDGDVGTGQSGASDGGATMSLEAVKLPVGEDILRLRRSSTTSAEGTDTPIAWNQQDNITPAYNHSSGSSSITISTAGNYLFFACMYARRGTTANDDPKTFFCEWKVNGTKLDYGGFGQYNHRNSGATSPHRASGAAGSVLLTNLNPGDTVELVSSDETTSTDDGTFEFQNNRQALQAIKISNGIS